MSSVSVPTGYPLLLSSELGFKVGALNVSKFCDAMRRKDKCAQKQKKEEK